MGVVSVLRNYKDIVVLVIMEWINLHHFQVAHPDVLLKALGHHKLTAWIHFPSKFFAFVDLASYID